MSDWLEALPCCIGQIFIAGEREGRISICHRDDRERSGLARYDAAEMAIQLARYDDAGVYRPLKTAPNLARGWQLVLRDREEARRALDYFYPGRAAAYARWAEGALQTTPLRQTLGRQTGMYRVTSKVTDEQADGIIAQVCRSDGGCLRTIRWKRDVDGLPASAWLPSTKYDPNIDQTGKGEPTHPLLCQEACNILVAEIRKAVKAS